jgi:hypothetical protein
MSCLRGGQQIGIWTVLTLVSGCAGTPLSHVANAEETGSNIAVFEHGSDQIIVDPDRRRLVILGTEHLLEDCSTEELHCLKSESANFHIVVPRNCDRSIVPGGDLAGGYRFLQINLGAHSHPRAGVYTSEIGNEFGYWYNPSRGIFEIRYDPAGKVKFGARDNGSIINFTETRAYAFRLSDDEVFLGCAR